MDIKLKNNDAKNGKSGAVEYDKGNDEKNRMGNHMESGMGYGKTGGEKSEKTSWKVGLFAAVLVTILFAIGFMALYPAFQKNAQVFERDQQQDSNLLTKMCVSNYIFYKDIVEKVEQTSYSYFDLYVDMEVTGTSGNILQDSDNYVNMDIDAFAASIRDNFNNDVHENWQSVALSEMAQLMDYCVMDNNTGEIIKNTGRNIEALTSENREEKAQLPYAYYVRVSYDSVGNLDKVAVKDENSDELLKKVQRVMKNGLLEQRMRDISDYYANEGTFYGYSEKDNCEKMMHYRLKRPHDVTFIYAMTQEQKQTMERNGMIGNRWSMWYVYYQSNVLQAFSLMLLMLAIVAFVLMNFKWYGLHRLKIAAIPLEIGILSVFVWFIAFSEWMVGIVKNTCTGEFTAMYMRNLDFLPDKMFPALTFLTNFGILFLLFGGWFYVVNSFGGALVLGIRGFLRERSMILKAGREIWKIIRRYYDRFKQEMLHVDLSEDAIQMVRKVVIVNFVLMAVMCSMWVFGWTTLAVYSIGLYFVLKKYVFRIQRQYGKMLEATNSIAEGNLDTVFDQDLGVFESYKEELYRIQEGFRKAVDEEVKSQRMKTELITNVSHDLATPLTAITTYIDLLKEENITEEQRREYLAVLEKKSLRLKILIEDLFEVSKANSRNVTVNLVDVDICNLMRQVYLEYADRVEEANLIFRFRMPQEKVILKLDSQKTYRIFENLYINIMKYAMPGTRVYVDMEQEEKAVRIELKNMSAMELHVQPDELAERFVRGDSARNTEGSGLGLAIAKSFVEVQGGRMEVTVDGDLFKVTLWF